ncbi:Hypothetical protein FKW44_012200 [Caligus rogercresseyi]|uniref:Uncharacterized protein n=1 Tax=Caligus rogercresseyi TaxID=217165 RepID=A0A7T8HJ16_CALRO|nr:Hypothetical protein FKW44_012200 [Caligus rogercresseyi]
MTHGRKGMGQFSAADSPPPIQRRPIQRRFSAADSALANSATADSAPTNSLTADSAPASMTLI